MPSNAHEAVVAALGRTLRLGLGSAVLAAGNGGRVIGGNPGLHAPGEPLPAEAWIDFAVGLADVTLEAAERTAAVLVGALAPASRLVGAPLGQVACQVQALIGPLVQPITERGRLRRLQAEQEAAAAAEALLPVATEVMMGKVDLKRMLEVSLDAVDMGAALDLIDLDHAMAATAERIDLTDIALQYIDMTRVMDAAMRSVDVAALLRVQLEGVDLQDLIISTPTNLAGEALRTTTRLVGGAAERGRWVRSLGAAALENGRTAGAPPEAVGGASA